MFSHMPPAQQKLILTLLGTQIQASQHMDCNLFGGRDACKALPETSTFASKCTREDLSVDCAYYQFALQETNDAPPSENITKMAQELNIPECEACDAHVDALWCAQSAPKCGSFDAEVGRVVIPTLSKVLDTMDAAKDKEEEEKTEMIMQVLADALPDLIKASSLSMPCRAMCEAVVDTCGCGRKRTFGSLIEAQVKRAEAEAAEAAQKNGTAYVPETAEAIEKVVFAKVWDLPLCELYAESTVEGFVGHCEVAAQPTASCGWCDMQTEDAVDFSQELLARSLAASLSWTGGSSGVIEGAKAAKDMFEKHKGGEDGSSPTPPSHETTAPVVATTVAPSTQAPAPTEPAEPPRADGEKETEVEISASSSSSSKSGGGGATMVVLIIVAVVLAMSVGAAGGVLYMRHRGMPIRFMFSRAGDSASRGVYFAMDSEMSELTTVHASP